jgi:hypothetical protein
MPDWSTIYERLTARIESYGIAVRAQRLGLETTGVFDGHSITTNTDYDLETRCHNIAHAFGHIAQWSLEYDRFRALYDQLYATKATRHTDAVALEQALGRFREYEEEASQHAAWLLLETGCADALPAFVLFARADIEAIVGFHRDDIAPIWRTFFAAFQGRMARGERQLRPFEPKPVPTFVPVRLEPQEVIQEVDGQAGPTLSGSEQRI